MTGIQDKGLNTRIDAYYEQRQGCTLPPRKFPCLITSQYKAPIGGSQWSYEMDNYRKYCRLNKNILYLLLFLLKVILFITCTLT